jgi:hypothetical protein
VFDIHQRIDSDDEIDSDKVADYIDGLMEEFAKAPEVKPLIDAGVGVGWAATMMDYAANYLGLTPPKMSLRDFNEVVFELIPRKVSTEPESAPAIVEELRAFWQFLRRQYAVENAGPILASLDRTALERLRRELADPSNFGMAKSFVMMGQKAGFDMASQEGLDAFIQAYNSQLAARRAQPLPSPFDSPFPPWARDPAPHGSKEAKRKERKRQRRARKRNRR